MEISVENAEKIFNEALDVLEGDLPECSEDCELCKWATESQLENG